MGDFDINISDESLTLSVEFDLPRSLIDRIMFRPVKTEIRQIVFNPLCIGGASQVFDVLSKQLPVKFISSFKGESELTMQDIISHQKQVMYIIGFGIQNNGQAPKRALLKSIEKNFTYEDMVYGFAYTIAQSGYFLNPAPKPVMILKYTPENLQERVRQLKQDLIGEPEPTSEQFGDMIEALQKAKNIITEKHAKH